MPTRRVPTRAAESRAWKGVTFYLALALFSFWGMSACEPTGRAATVDHPPAQGRVSGTAGSAAGWTAPVLLPCAGPQPLQVMDLAVRHVPEYPEPLARRPFLDPVFGTCIVRVTDRSVDLAPDDPSPGLKNEYSRVQSFNADGSLLLAYALEGSWYLYDARTLDPLGGLNLSGSVAPRWDAFDPHVLYYSEDARLMAMNVRSGAGWLVHDFAADFPGQDLAAVWTRWEGSPSADGYTWGLMAEDETWLAVALLVYDQGLDQVVARRDLRGLPPEQREIDSVTISPLGNYLVAYFDAFCAENALGSDGDACGVMVYDRHLARGRGLARVSTHSDLALDASGREVMIFDGYDTDSISLADLETGNVEVLWPVDFTHCTGCGVHYSGRAFRRPGWVLVSTHDGAPVSYSWMDHQIFAVELRPAGRVVRLAHTHSLVHPEQEQDYWAEPQASVDLDFTHIVFTTNWGRSGTGEVEMFMIELPADWTAQLH